MKEEGKEERGSIQGEGGGGEGGGGGKGVAGGCRRRGGRSLDEAG